ncbi:MAG: hypothetical protein KIH65_005275 [Candidatus Uhrbacteria bacterium]|nr:hypothetical protein [Candidatus Uhrbacteria bacterium]
MAQLNFFHICGDAFLTEGSRALNVIGIFDQVHAQKFPALIPSFATVAHVTAMEGVHKLKLIIKHEGNSVAEIASEFTGSNHQWISHYAGMSFPVAGEYLFEIRVDDELIGTKRLEIKQV